MELNDNLLFVQSLSLIIVSHHDMLQQQNVENILAEFDVNPLLSKGINVLIDVRKADIAANIEEIEQTSASIYRKLKNSGIEKFAILSGPRQLNKVVEFVKTYPQSSKYQVFDNLESVMHWLKIPMERKSQLEVKLDYLLKF